MNPDQRSPLPKKGFSVGDKVRAVKTLHSPPSHELPAQDFCSAGDVLEVRKVGGFWPYSVAHPEMTPGAMFGVQADEIAPLDERSPSAEGGSSVTK